MAKAKTSNSAGETTLSARFDGHEIDMLRRAAEIKNWSLSQLIRMGAYEKAVNIINASNARSTPIRGIIAEVATQLFNPDVSYYYNDERVEGRDLETLFYDGHHAQASKLDAGVGDAFSEAIVRLGAEIVPLLKDECSRVHAKGGAQDVRALLLDPRASEISKSSEGGESRNEALESSTGSGRKPRSSRSAKRGQ